MLLGLRYDGNQSWSLGGVFAQLLSQDQEGGSEFVQQLIGLGLFMVACVLGCWG